MGFLPNERQTRKFITSSAALSFPFVIATCIVSIDSRYWWSDNVVPIPFSFIPLVITIFSSMAYFNVLETKPKTPAEETSNSDHAREHHTGHKHTRIQRRVWIFLDILVSLGYVGVLIPVWVIEPGYMGSGLMILESYATCFLVVNMVSHFYIACLNIRDALKYPGFAYTQCPNCHCELPPLEEQTSERNATGGYSGVRGEIYLDEEAEVEGRGLLQQTSGDGVEGRKVNVAA